MIAPSMSGQRRGQHSSRDSSGEQQETYGSALQRAYWEEATRSTSPIRVPATASPHNETPTMAASYRQTSALASKCKDRDALTRRVRLRTGMSFCGPQADPTNAAVAVPAAPTAQLRWPKFVAEIGPVVRVESACLEMGGAFFGNLIEIDSTGRLRASRCVFPRPRDFSDTCVFIASRSKVSSANDLRSRAKSFLRHKTG